MTSLAFFLFFLSFGLSEAMAQPSPELGEQPEEQSKQETAPTPSYGIDFSEGINIDDESRDVNTFISKSSATQLEKFIMYNKMEDVKKSLEENPAQINPKDTKNGFPLMYAVIANSPDMVEFLISKGAKVDTSMDQGVTPLVMAVHWNLIDVVKVLLKHKANVHIKIQGATLVDVAKASLYMELEDYLKEYIKANPNPATAVPAPKQKTPEPPKSSKPATF